MNVKVSDIPVVLLAAAAFILIVAGIQAAAAILIPFLLAVFIATLCAPLPYWLQRRGVPNGLAVLIIFLGLLVTRGPSHVICRKIIEFSLPATPHLSRTPGGDHNPGHYLAEQPGGRY